MRRLGRWALDGYAVLVLAYLFLPIFVIVLYSFNKPAGKFNFVWKAFSLDAWRHPFAYPALVEAMKLSLRVAALSTIVATLFGTLIALALTRYRFRGSGAVNLLLVLPLTTPEVVLGSSLLSLFLGLNAPTGFGTIAIAHIMFSVSYVALTVRARIRGFDWTLEEAAMDLGATPLRVFTRVTLPLIAPGIVAASLLAFALSLDDFIITLFNAGNRVTYPLYVYGARRAAFPPQINVLATAILLVSLLVLGATVVWGTGGRADGRTGRRADGQTGGRADGRTGRRADGQTGRRADGRTG
jgi:spermidine/putrescine transport system permease protein